MTYALLSAGQLGRNLDDWMEAFEGSRYETSVLRAANPQCLLAPCDLERLLNAHGANRQELDDAISAGRTAGHAWHPAEHAGQALAWLGYC